MNPARNVLILSFSPIHRDPRVMRQIRLLESRLRLSVAGFGTPPDAKVSFTSLDPAPGRRFRLRTFGPQAKLLLGLSESYYWSRPEVRLGLKTLQGRNYDLVIANDVPALPLGLRIANGAPLLLDAHEYSPAELEDRLTWRIRYGRHYQKLCARYLNRASAMTTVCRGLAEEYKQNFGVSATVIENAPARQNLRPRPIQPGRIRMIHHGGAQRARRLELMIDVMARLDQRFSLDFMLVGNDASYLQELRNRASRDPRIRFVPPVRMEDICRMTNDYDVGLYLLPPLNFNQRFALPNKLFEFIQARLAIAIGPSPEMARIVRQHGVGVVADSFEPAALAGVLSSLTDQEVSLYKRASHAAADRLCFEAAADRMLALIERLLQPGAAGGQMDAGPRS